MKKFILFLVLLSSTFAFAQSKKSCCSSSATEKFALFASNEKFSSAHLNPLPFNFVPAKGTMVTYKTGNDKSANAFLVKSEQSTDNWIIMVHEWWGLNDYIKQEAEKLQQETGNANVLAIDLYDGNVATKASEAQKLMGEMKEDRVIAIIKGAILFAGSKAKIYTIGWCMGGGWSMQASLLAGKQAAGCVMYYGMPETDLTKLSKLNADVLGIFATKDQWINQKVVDQFKADMKALNKKLEVKSFDADHAFANPSNPKFDRDAAGQAHLTVLSFLKKHLK